MEICFGLYYARSTEEPSGQWVKEYAQNTLSEKIGKSNTTVSKYVNQRVQPDLITLNSIADALEVDVKDLLVSNK